jgi:hypothetical protein
LEGAVGLRSTRIDQVDSKIFKVPDVARCDGRFSRDGNTRDLQVANFNRAANLASCSRDSPRSLRG